MCQSMIQLYSCNQNINHDKTGSSFLSVDPKVGYMQR